MAKANIARLQGDEYQLLFFWWRACDLFFADRGVESVALEKEGVKGFDDVAVYYRPGAMSDQGEPIDADFFQLKFHVTANGAFTGDGMMDPAFINAESVSLLQRLRYAQEAHAPDGRRARFFLYTPWQVHPDDPLASVLSQADGHLRLDELFAAGPKSKLGQMRKKWREHLNLKTDEQLRVVLRPLRLLSGGTLHDLKERLAGVVHLAGLAPLAQGKRLQCYAELARKLMTEGRIEFNRSRLEDICKQEGLWQGGPVHTENAVRVGIRSFMRGASQMDKQEDYFLDLAGLFEERRLKEGRSWKGDIYPAVRDFLVEKIEGQRRCLLTLAAHSTIAFIAGYILDSKMGVEVLMQQPVGNGVRTWTFDDDTAASERAPEWAIEETRPGGGEEIAVAISLTHNVVGDVRAYLDRTQPGVGLLLHFHPRNGFGPAAVSDGAHARRLAEALVAAVRERRSTSGRTAMLHVFYAAPNAFVFSLGRLGRSLGQLMLHEHAFGGSDPSAYSPSLSLPIS